MIGAKEIDWTAPSHKARTLVRASKSNIAARKLATSSSREIDEDLDRSASEINKVCYKDVLGV